MITVKELGGRARAAAPALAAAGTADKNRALFAVADALAAREEEILAANRKDVEAGRAGGMTSALLDRLTLTPARVAGMVGGVRQVAALEDPVGQTDHVVRRPNGLLIGARRVPLGVVGLIYEARPNVTVDAAVLCLKAGNAVLLRGGKEAIHTNRCLSALMREALSSCGLPADAVCFVEDTARGSAVAMMELVGVLDVLIPRGGAGLIRSVVENARVPVIETGVGNCHAYVDTEADLEMAVRIVDNGKTSRPSVCNALETLLVARPVAPAFLPLVKRKLDEKQVELRGCPETAAILGDAVRPAVESDWETEFSDYILAVKVVSDAQEAMDHIARYGSGHSEVIITNNYFTAQRFVDRVDAAAVYVNASTRFTDGEEFGLGAEIGISTQKMHTRGPMGLAALTSIKYVVHGTGQVR
ncbi:MAG: glutamate-5-semialdehyde dehydrogenase [Oscillospiraceae bacterium]|jgi:glutamate-5-semialdehyde dehydrogenase|nr:glutamate-5-semialdehyde dehydrogenase [Oscillospiraceae bacterium]